MVRLEVTEDAVVVWDLHTHYLYGGAAYIKTTENLEITNLYLDEEIRGKGIGTMLIVFLLDFFGMNLSLGVMLENKRAQKFYRELDFELVRKVRTGPALILELRVFKADAPH